jgi:NACalpha-BTF3-like transcription factor
MDTAKAQAAMSQLESAAAAEKAARLERERELAKVKIDSKDVKLIMEGEYACAPE